jgi:hypothetical protein
MGFFKLFAPGIEDNYNNIPLFFRRTGVVAIVKNNAVLSCISAMAMCLF